MLLAASRPRHYQFSVFFIKEYVYYVTEIWRRSRGSPIQRFGSFLSLDNRICTYAVDKQEAYCMTVVQLIMILMSDALCAMTDVMVG